jgi:hypothetical protein
MNPDWSLAVMFRAAATILGLMGGAVVAADPDSKGSSPPATLAPAKLSEAQIERLIADLDSESYQARRQATRTLAGCGDAVVPRVLAAAKGRSLETTARAVEVLKYLAMSPDDVTEDAAYGALEQLSQLPSPSSASRALAAMQTLKETRQDRTIARIRDLGGNVSEPYSPTVFAGGKFRVMGRARGVVIVGPGGIVEDVESGSGSIAVTIDAAKWKPGREGMKVLRKLSTITQLVLEGKEVDDAWVAELSSAPIKDLQYVTFRRTSITDKSLEHIAKWKSLASIDVMYAPLTDAGVMELAKLKNVQSVRLYGTRVSQAGALRLDGALVGARAAETKKAPDPDEVKGLLEAVSTAPAIVDRRGGALLGVRGALGEDGCEINEVTADSAAEKAGIRPGDTIVTFDNKVVKNFNELTAAISDKAGGDKVNIEISRDGKRMTVEATLGEW